RPPGDLAAYAITTGRRMRRRRRVVTALGAVVAVAALAAPFVWLRPDAGPPVAGPAPTPTGSGPTASAGPVLPASEGNWRDAPLELPGGWVVTGATSTGLPARGGFVLDRDHDRYVEVDDAYEEVWTAPAGQVAAVRDYDRPQETGLLDVSSGRVRWFRTGQPILNPTWSPDGKRLALTILDKETASFALGVLGVDGSFRTFPVDASGKYLCTDYCLFTWTPDGRQVVLQQTDPAAPRSESEPHARRGLQLFSADTAAPARFVPVRGDAGGPFSWSPDGKLVVVKGQQAAQLVEVDTGRVLNELPSPDMVFVAADRLLLVGRDGEAALTDLTGRVLERQALPSELTGMLVAVGPR
ncbi:MAG TPA: hypothetical protein VGD43_25280, partial [Micromonospora sp.]